MPKPSVALAIVFTVACSGPAESEQQSAAVDAGRATEPVPPNPSPLGEPKRKPPPKIDPPDELLGKGITAPPSLSTLALTTASRGELPLPEGIGVVLPHLALPLEQGLLLAGQAFVEYDRQIRATEVWHYQGFVAAAGEPRASKGDLGSIRAGVLDGKGGAVLVGSLGVGFEARGWAARIGGDGSLVETLAIEPPGYSDALAVAGGVDGELAVLAGFTGQTAWMQAFEPSGATRWIPSIDARGDTQLRALVRLGDRRLLGLGTLASRDAGAWWIRVVADGSQPTSGEVEIDGVDPRRILYAVANRGEAGLIGLGLAKRGIAQDHDQVFAIGFDSKGDVQWSRAIDQVRATQIRGAIGTPGAGLFVLEVPLADSTQLALLRVGGPADPEIRVDALADTAGQFSPGFVGGTDPAEILVFGSTGSTSSWRRLMVTP